MEINSSDFESTCGPQPSGIFYEDPGNNPNFIFVNDENFDPVKLFDIDGNIVFVNSWVECVHYLQGGWMSDKMTTLQGDKYLSIGLFVICCLTTVAIIYINRKKNEAA